MSILTKLTKQITYTGYLTEFRSSVCPAVKRYFSEVRKTEEDDTENEFRILRLIPQKESGRKPMLRGKGKDLVKDVKYAEDVDWTNVWVGPKTFDPYMVPLPIRQGFVQKGVAPGKYANAELMKIPNFLHLTPPAIEKHCAALKKFCTDWPKGLETEKKMNKHFPITVIASDYCHSSPSIRDPLSRIITLEVHIDALDLDDHAKDKFLRLVGDRYNAKTGIVMLTTMNCPLKKQNYDHAMYTLTALCFESWKVEDWEEEKTLDDMVEYCFNLRKPKSNVEAYFNYTGKTAPSLEEIGEIVEKYVTQEEDLNLFVSLKEQVLKLLNLPAFNSDKKMMHLEQ